MIIGLHVELRECLTRSSHVLNIYGTTLMTFDYYSVIQLNKNLHIYQSVSILHITYPIFAVTFVKDFFRRDERVAGLH